MKLAFCGTPAPAVTVLDALVAAGHDVSLVVTRPDKRRGRGSALAPSPVKEAATRHGVPVAHKLAALESLDVDMVIIVAYGAIVPDRLLEQFTFLNVHFSLLPRWRGAAPVERAILAGDAETGVCVMGLESTLDTGAVYATRATNIGTKSAADLLAELAVLGAETLIDVLATPGGLPAPQPQRGVATYADKLTPNDFFLAPSDDTAALLAKVRCGRAFSYLDGVRYKVLVADAVDHVGPAGSVTKEGWWCAMTGALRPLVLQAEGSRSMNLESWLAGRRGAMPRTWGIEPTSAP